MTDDVYRKGDKVVEEHYGIGTVVLPGTEKVSVNFIRPNSRLVRLSLPPERLRPATGTEVEADAGGDSKKLEAAANLLSELVNQSGSPAVQETGEIVVAFLRHLADRPQELGRRLSDLPHFTGAFIATEERDGLYVEASAVQAALAEATGHSLPEEVKTEPNWEPVDWADLREGDEIRLFAMDRFEGWQQETRTVLGRNGKFIRFHCPAGYSNTGGAFDYEYDPADDDRADRRKLERLIPDPESEEGK